MMLLVAHVYLLPSQNTFHDIQKESSKLRTYSLLKKQIGYECYLSQIRNIDHRITLTNFRLSNHRLKIETGRHQRIDKNKRFCPFCPDEVEDEIHFLVQCKTYKTFRENLFDKIDTHRNFHHLDKTRKFINLLTNNNHINEIALYLHKTFHCREFLLHNYKNTI